MTKTLYLNPNKIENYWTSNIQQKLTECNHDIHFHCANIHNDTDNKSMWVYGLASIGAPADSYGCIKPGSKPSGDLETVDMDWSKPDPEKGTFLALEFHYDKYEIYDYKSRERKQVEPCGTELGLAKILQNTQHSNSDNPFSITLVLLAFPITLVEPVAKLPLPLDLTQQMTQIVVGSLSKPCTTPLLETKLPAFNPPQSKGGYQKKYKTPAERLAERENAMKDYVTRTYEALGFSTDSLDELKDALSAYPANPLTAKIIIDVSFADLPAETRKVEAEKFIELLNFVSRLI